MRRLLIAGMLLLLTGCASFTPKPLDPGTSQRLFDSRSLTSPAVRRFFKQALDDAVTVWPPESWNIATLTLAAYYYQPGIDVAQARSLLAEAGILTAAARPNPTLSTSLEHNADAPAGVSPWTAGLGILVPIETAGKRGYRIQQAQFRAQAAKLRELDMMWRIRSRVRRRLLAIYPVLPLMQQQSDLQQKIVRVLERRFSVGFASRPDVAQARLMLNQSILELQKNQTRRAEDFARVAASIGVPVNALKKLPISFAAFTRLVPISRLPSADIRRKALLRRPDILAALADYEASQSALQLEIARQYPDISLGPGYRWDAGAAKWSLGLSLVLPLLNHNQGPIAEAEARRREVGLRFLAVQAAAIAQMEQASAGYSHAVRMVDTADALLGNQQKREYAVRAAYRAGETDRLALLEARYQSVTIELARTNALIQAQQTLGRLEDALHLPLGRDIMVPAGARVLSLKQFR